MMKKNFMVQTDKIDKQMLWMKLNHTIINQVINNRKKMLLMNQKLKDLKLTVSTFLINKYLK